MAKGATATPTAGEALESTELDSANTLLELQKDANKYDSLDNSKEAIIARRKLNDFEDQLISQQPIDLEEVVVTGFRDNLTGRERTRAGRETAISEKRKQEARLATKKIQTAQKNIPKEDIQKQQANIYFDLPSIAPRDKIDYFYSGGYGMGQSSKPMFESDEELYRLFKR